MNRIRFGSFEVDPRSRELRKAGIRLHLENQPFEILLALLEKPGEVVTRSDLQRRVWRDGTFVDFEKSLTKAVNKLRAALSDSAATPRFVETLARRGYRFIAPVECAFDPPGSPAPPLQHQPEPPSPSQSKLPWRSAPLLAAAVIGVLSLASIITFSTRNQRIRALSAPQPMRSLVVLPFENLTGDASQEYLADGLSDQIAGYLARIGSVRLISRTSAMKYKGARQSLPEIARELAVEGAIEGSVHRAGNGVRINVRLMQAHADRQLWAGVYEGAPDHTSRLERQITLAVANQISARLTAEDTTRIFRGAPRNPRAYESYLRGRHLWNQRGTAAIEAAGAHFSQALLEDPQFALAYAGLADRYTIGWGAATDYSLSEKYARRAVELEPELAEAHTSLAMSLICQFRFAGGEAELKRAVELNPNYVTARQFYTIYWLAQGNPREALIQSDLALALDPFSIPVNNMRTFVLLALGRNREALDQALSTRDLGPDRTGLRTQLIRIHWLEGRAAEALAEERRVASQSQRQDWVRGIDEIQAVYQNAGYRAACLRSALLKERVYDENFPLGQFIIPLQFALVRDNRKVLAWIDRFLDKQGYIMPLILKTAPEFDYLQADPAFHQRLRRAGLNLSANSVPLR